VKENRNKNRSAMLRKRLKIKIISLIVLSFPLFYSVTFAQSLRFLPPQISLVTYKLINTRNIGVYSDGSVKESVLSKTLRQNRIPADAIDGSIEYEDNHHLINFQYGLIPSFNVGITVPYLVRQRKSDLTVQQAGYSTFDSDYSSTEASGLGDLEIWGLWRVFYSDDLDFQLGLKLNGDNAPHYFDQPENLSLGNGFQEISGFLDLTLYTSRYPFSAVFRLAQTLYITNKTNDSDGVEQKIVKAHGLKGSMGFSYNVEKYSFGGSILLNTESDTTISGISQSDGYLSYAYRLYCNMGNLHLLEKSSIKRPWESQIALQNVFRGSNADHTTEIGISASLYF